MHLGEPGVAGLDQRLVVIVPVQDIGLGLLDVLGTLVLAGLVVLLAVLLGVRLRGALHGQVRSLLLLKVFVVQIFRFKIIMSGPTSSQKQDLSTQRNNNEL